MQPLTRLFFSSCPLQPNQFPDTLRHVVAWDSSHENILVNSGTYLFELARHIKFNPIRTGMIKILADRMV